MRGGRRRFTRRTRGSVLLLAGHHRELGVFGLVRRTGHIRVAFLDVEAAAVQLLLESLGAEVLQPVVDGAGARLFDNGVLVEDHLLLVIREGVEETVIAVRRPEAVQEIISQVASSLRPAKAARE